MRAMPAFFSPRLPFLIVALVALVALAVFFAHDAPPAQGQPTTVTFVKNYGQSQAQGNLSTNNNVQAQGFATGSRTGGYVLNGIGMIPVGTAPNAAQLATVRAELWLGDEDHEPDSKVVSLTVPSSMSSGSEALFAAPDDTWLVPSQTYFFVLYTTGNYSLPISRTTSTSEDSGAATGWSIRDERYQKSTQAPTDTGTWTSVSSNQMRIQVKGHTETVTGPGAPRNVQLIPWDNAFKVVWDPPESWGTWEPAGFNIEVYAPATGLIWNQLGDSGAGVTSRRYAPQPIGNVDSNFAENGHLQKVRIRAWTRMPGTDGSLLGSYLYSQRSNEAEGTPTAATVTPGAVGALAASPGDRKVEVAWAAPDEGTISDYDVHYTTSSTAGDNDAVGNSASQGWLSADYRARIEVRTTEHLEPQWLIQNLTNTTQYRFRVRAKNSAGGGPWSFVTATPTATALPTAQWLRSVVTVQEADYDKWLFLEIALSKALTGSAELSVAQVGGTATAPSGADPDWEPLENRCVAGSAGDTHLRCIIVIKGDNTQESDETIGLRLNRVSGSFFLTGRRNMTVTIEDDDEPPGAPTDLQVTKGSGQLALSWTAPVDVDGPAYSVQYTSAPASGAGAVFDDAARSGSDPAAGWIPGGEGFETSQTLTGLTNNTAYRLRVNAGDAGIFSPFTYGTGTPNPAAATDLSSLTGESSAGGASFAALSLHPVFDTDRTAYRATVGHDVTHVRLTPTLAVSASSAQVGRPGSLASVASGSASGSIPLAVGDNAITVRVTDADNNSKDYTVTVRRARSGSVWWATLTPRSINSGTGMGCSGTAAACSAPGTLSDHEFTHGDVDYEIDTFVVITGGELVVTLPEEQTWDGLTDLELRVGSATFAVADGTTTASAPARRGWTSSGLTFTPGDSVSVVLGVPPLPAPDAFEAHSANRALVATWSYNDDPAPHTGYVVQYKTAAAADRPAAAANQPAAATLVKNYQSQAQGSPNTGANVLAQGFTTGSHRNGYVLNAVGMIHFGSNPNAAALGTLRAELWSTAAGGEPGSRLAELTVPSSMSSGSQSSFRAPEDTWLAPGATYYFLLYTTGTYGLTFTHTGTTAEDSGQASGWSIADERYTWNRRQPGQAGGTWTSTTGEALRINVVGYAETAGDPATGWVTARRAGLDGIQVIGGLANGTTYNVRVGAVNVAGVGAWAAADGAPEQTTAIWTATLTAKDLGSGKFGCENNTSGKECSAAAVLSEDEFWYGQTYRLAEISADSALLTFGLSADSTGLESNAVWVVDDEPHPWGSGLEVGSTGVAFSYPPAWAADQSVAVSLQVRGEVHPAAPGAPSVAAGSGKLDVSWTAPSGTVTGYDVHYTASTSVDDDAAVGSAVATEWVATSRAATDASLTQEITGLTNGDTYRVRVRAKNSAGPSPWAHGTGTPEAAPQSTNNNLSGLTASSATGPSATFNALTLSPTFAAATVAYTATVANDQTHVKLTPTVEDTGKATVQVGKSGSLATVASGSASAAISLSAGSNAIIVRVAAENSSTRDYTVTVTRQQSSNNNLSGLTAGRSSDGVNFSALTLSPNFAAGVTTYTAAVANDQTHVRLTPTAAHAAATITVNGTAVNSGSASGAIAVSVGSSNVITVQVTAQDATTRDYTVTITRAAAVPTVSLSASPNPVAEGSSVTVTATLSATLSGSVTIPLTVTDGTAEPADRGTLANITISANALSGTGTITTTQDTAVEGEETFTVALDTSSLPSDVAAGSPSSVQVRITDDDIATVSLSVSPTTVNEGDSVTVTAQLSRTLTDPLTVPLTVTRGTSEAGDHGTLASITINAGARSAAGTITTTADADEADETFTVALDTANLPSTVTAGATTSVEVTIADQDATATLAAAPNPVTEGEAVTITVSLTRAPARAVTIPLTVTRETSEEADHGTLASIRINAGATSGAGSIPTRHDDGSADEAFTVAIDTSNLPANVQAGSPSSVRVVIDDDDTPTVDLTARPRTVTAGDSVTITAMLSAALPADVTIPLRVTSEPGTQGNDHGTLSGIRIAAGATSGTGLITTRSDSDTGYERFKVSLDTDNLPAEVQAGRLWVRVTIAPVGKLATVWLSASPNPVDEGGTVTVTAHLDHALSEAVTIPLLIFSGDPDAHGTLAEIEIAANATSGTGALDTYHDADALDEYITITLGDLPQGVRQGRQSEGHPSSVKVTVRDDET